jgi:hypothetical protein
MEAAGIVVACTSAMLFDLSGGAVRPRLLYTVAVLPRAPAARPVSQ